MYGDISAWFFSYLGGIQPDPQQPGFQHFKIHVHPVSGLTWARATYRSPYGLIRSAWKNKDGKFSLEIDIPANSDALVYLPVEDITVITEGGQPVIGHGDCAIIAGTGGVCVRIGAGSYRFETSKLLTP